MRSERLTSSLKSVLSIDFRLRNRYIYRTRWGTRMQLVHDSWSKTLWVGLTATQDIFVWRCLTTTALYFLQSFKWVWLLNVRSYQFRSKRQKSVRWQSLSDLVDVVSSALELHPLVSDTFCMSADFSAFFSIFQLSIKYSAKTVSLRSKILV